MIFSTIAFSQSEVFVQSWLSVVHWQLAGEHVHVYFLKIGIWSLQLDPIAADNMYSKYQQSVRESRGCKGTHTVLGKIRECWPGMPCICSTFLVQRTQPEPGNTLNFRMLSFLLASWSPLNVKQRNHAFHQWFLDQYFVGGPGWVRCTVIGTWALLLTRTYLNFNCLLWYTNFTLAC